MNKNELVSDIAKEVGMKKVDTERVLDTLINIITNTLIRGEKVSLVGFGVFESVQRAAKKGRNPKTGEVLEMDAYKAVKFRPGSALKRVIRGDE